jgi:hypothetical protein
MPFDYYGGIDFSGAKEPLSNLWTAIGAERDGKLHIVALLPHPYRADLGHCVAGGWRRTLGVPASATILWGADFPFGIPAEAAVELVGARAGWGELLAWVADRPADEIRGQLPDHHRTRRRTDTGKAMPPFDLKLYKQTVEGLRWLHELRETLDRAELAIHPQLPQPGAQTCLIEVYPSGTMVDLAFRCRRVPSRPGEVRARPAALRTFLTFDDPSLEAIAVTLEDAWDATIACLSAFLAREDLEQPFRTMPAEAHDVVRREGWIYRPPAALG